MTQRKAAAAVLVLFPAVGCNPAKMWELPFGGPESRPAVVTAPPLRTQDVTWRGWSAIEQGNGLITLRHVPAAGGRTLSLEINGDDAFLVFPDQQGRTYPADSRDNSVHFGGHYACIGPEARWSVHEQPFNPHAGPYQPNRRTSLPDQHSLEMSSRPDTWKGATISIERTITLYQGTTHVVIDETVTNRGPQDLDFYIWDFTQIDALDHRRPGRELRRLTFYLPVPRRGTRKDYHSFLPREPRMEAQFDESLPADILAVRFAAVQFKIASHPGQWWTAAVDHDTGWTYVKAFDADAQARYADGNGPVELYGSDPDSPREQPFVEMELLTGLKRCPPGGGITQREHWFASTCKGPVLAFTPAGLVCENLSASREKGYYDVKGRFAVFHLGSARLKILDRRDAELFAGQPVLIDPRREFVLSQSLPVQQGGDVIVLEVYDAQGRRVDELARIRVP